MRLRFFGLCCVALYAACAQRGAQAVTTVFFHPSLMASNVAAGSTSDTITCRGYLFTYSRDKWWYPTISLGPGTPTGRPVRVPWPAGIEAQAVTAGPSGTITNGGGANITITRVDGAVFDIASFTAQILGSTAGAGAAFEIMPLVNGEDAFPEPLMFNATGYGGQSFSYTTPALAAYDTYKVHLWMDFALTALTLVDATPEPPALEASLTTSNHIRLAWSAETAGYVLQTSLTPTPGQFTNAAVAAVVEGDFQAVYWPATNSCRFFRLAY